VTCKHHWGLDDVSFTHWQQLPCSVRIYLRCDKCGHRMEGTAVLSEFQGENGVTLRSSMLRPQNRKTKRGGRP
jgi:hypothetical protein